MEVADIREVAVIPAEVVTMITTISLISGATGTSIAMRRRTRVATGVEACSYTVGKLACRRFYCSVIMLSSAPNVLVHMELGA